MFVIVTTSATTLKQQKNPGRILQTFTLNKAIHVLKVGAHIIDGIEPKVKCRH